MLINIPFQYSFKDKMLNNGKTCTSRTKKYGNPGDKFEIFGATFVITKITRLSLNFIANHLFEEEGCNSPGNFRSVWLTLHERSGWRPLQRVYVHFFRKE